MDGDTTSERSGRTELTQHLVSNNLRSESPFEGMLLKTQHGNCRQDCRNSKASQHVDEATIPIACAGTVHPRFPGIVFSRRKG